MSRAEQKGGSTNNSTQFCSLMQRLRAMRTVDGRTRSFRPHR